MKTSKINQTLAQCTSVQEAVSRTGMTHKQVYFHLKKQGIDMKYPHKWFSQIHEINYSVEFELENSIR